MNYLFSLWGMLLLLSLSCGGQVLEVAVFAERLSYRQASFDVVRLASADQLQFFSRNEKGEAFADFQELEQDVARRGRKLLFATNGGIFEPDFQASGLYVENGKIISPLNQKAGKGNFYLEPNGVFYIGETEKNILTTAQYAQQKPKAKHAIQSGPMLVIKDKIHPRFNEGSPNRYVRSGVGIDKEGRIWLAISNEPVNLYHFASLFKERLSCPNALYLDGAISQMYLPELGRKDKGRQYGTLLVISQ